MEKATEIIEEASHKRNYVPHVIVCPCLMKHLQRKEFIKDSDLPFTIPTSLSFYPNTFHETLCIALVFALIKRSNWKRSWAIQGIQISRAFLERPEGGFKVAVGSRPPVPPIMGRELRQMQKDPVRGGGGGGYFSRIFYACQGQSPPARNHGAGYVTAPPLGLVPNGVN